MSNPEEVIRCARSWLGTPYHHMARKKGAGVDCGQLIVASFAEAGAIKDFDPGFYTHDWHLHRDEERYVALVEEYFDRVPGDDDKSLDDRISRNGLFEVAPADVVVFRVGRTFSHGGIVTQWPAMVHSYLSSTIVEEVSLLNTPMSERVMRVYRLKDWMK